MFTNCDLPSKSPGEPQFPRQDPDPHDRAAAARHHTTSLWRPPGPDPDDPPLSTRPPTAQDNGRHSRHHMTAAVHCGTALKLLKMNDSIGGTATRQLMRLKATGGG